MPARLVTRAQIPALSAVREHGAFAQASRHAQTSLHRSAGGLEKRIGAPLFTNAAEGIRTNKSGARLAGAFLPAVRELEWAGEEIRSQQGALRGRLLVGSLPLAGNQFIAARLDGFVSAHPDIRVQLTHGPATSFWPSCAAGRSASS